jgi:hypothetical protein
MRGDEAYGSSIGHAQHLRGACVDFEGPQGVESVRSECASRTRLPLDRAGPGASANFPTPIALGHEWEGADKAAVRDRNEVTGAGNTGDAVAWGDGALGLVCAYHLPLCVRTGGDVAGTVRWPGYP